MSGEDNAYQRQGGPAFPAMAPAAEDIYGNDVTSGMSLRDYFAAQAITHRSLLAETPSRVADWAYSIADAMLAERAKSNVHPFESVDEGQNTPGGLK
jgi:hypothetical protein